MSFAVQIVTGYLTDTTYKASVDHNCTHQQPSKECDQQSLFYGTPYSTLVKRSAKAKNIWMQIQMFLCQPVSLTGQLSCHKGHEST